MEIHVDSDVKTKVQAQFVMYMEIQCFIRNPRETLPKTCDRGEKIEELCLFKQFYFPYEYAD